MKWILVAAVFVAGFARGDELADLRKEVAELRAENARLKATTAPVGAVSPRKWFYAYGKNSEGRATSFFVAAEFKLDASNKAKARGIIDPTVRDATRVEAAQQDAEAAAKAAQPGILDPSKRIKVGDSLDDAIALLGPTDHEEKSDGGGTTVWWRVYAPVVTARGGFNAGVVAQGGGQSSGGGKPTITHQVQAEFDAAGKATQIWDDRK